MLRVMKSLVGIYPFLAAMSMQSSWNKLRKYRDSLPTRFVGHDWGHPSLGLSPGVIGRPSGSKLGGCGGGYGLASAVSIIALVAVNTITA